MKVITIFFFKVAGHHLDIFHNSGLLKYCISFLYSFLSLQLTAVEMLISIPATSWECVELS